jgi:hypothetical protein
MSGQVKEVQHGNDFTKNQSGICDVHGQPQDELWRKYESRKQAALHGGYPRYIDAGMRPERPAPIHDRQAHGTKADSVGREPSAKWREPVARLRVS